MSEKVNKILYLVLSLLVAVVFWLYVDTELDSKSTVTFSGMPIEFIGAEDTLPNQGLMLVAGEDATLDATFSGSRSVISNLRRSDIRFQVDLSNVHTVGPHTLTYDFTTADNINKSSINLEQVSRSTVTVEVGLLYARELPVTVNMEGEVADGYIYMAERRTVEPSAITLSGRAEDVDLVDSIRVVVDLTNATNTVQQDYRYELLDAEGNVVENDGIRVSDRYVEVTAPVFVQKELPLTVRYKESAGSTRENAECVLKDTSITVAGEPANLEEGGEIVLSEVDLSAYLSDVDGIPLEIKLPAGCVNLSGINSTTLSIHFHGLETRSFTVTNILATGLSENQRFDPITTSVDVVIRGPASVLEQVTPEDIRIVVDLMEYTSDVTVAGLPGKVLVDGYSNVGAVGVYNISGKIISSR